MRGESFPESVGIHFKNLHLREFFLKAVEDLNYIEADYALVGEVAVSIRSEARTTRDIDFAVAISSDEEAEKLVFALKNQGYQIEEVLERKLTREISTIRLRAPTIYHSKHSPMVDLLFKSSGIEKEIVQMATKITVYGKKVRVAKRSALIATKILSLGDPGREQDLIDARKLIECASTKELHEAKKLLLLIKARGLNREKDIEKSFGTICLDIRKK